MAVTFSPVVAFTVNDRPNYLRRTLDSWSKVRGVDRARMLYVCEPGCAEAQEVCESARIGLAFGLMVNSERKGVLGNPWHALDMAFEVMEADFAILAEDDLIVSPDTLEYFDWCQRYADDSNVLGVTTCQRREQPGGLAGVGPADWSEKPPFWVWGTWRDRWDAVLRDNWDKDYRSDCGCPPDELGWDWWFRNHLLRDKGMTMVAPSLSRSQHIGKYGGTHAVPAQFEKLLSRCFAGLDVPIQHYQEVTR